MSFVIQENGVLSTIAEYFKPVIAKSISTAILIITISLVVVLLVFNGKNGVIRTAFWLFIFVTSIIYLHDMVVVHHDNKGGNEGLYKDVRYEPPKSLANGGMPVTPNISTSNSHKQIIMPRLGIPANELKSTISNNNPYQ